MKTKEEVKKSRSKGVEESSGAKLEPTPSPGYSPGRASWLLDSSTLNFLYDRSGNVYENKGRFQEVEESKSRRVERCEAEPVSKPRLQPGPGELASRLRDSQLSTLNFLYERSGNVLENKG
jgi:hypothetical protein